MKRREFISLLGGAATLAIVGRSPGAQQPAKAARIGYLSPGSPPASPAFWQEMRDLGYVEGQNILVEYRWAEGKPERLPELAMELSRLKVEVVVAFGTQATFALKSAATTIPVIFQTHADPVEAGFVGSLGRPGGIFTGFTLLAPDLAGKRLALLKEAAPATSRVAVLVNTANPGMQSTLTHLEAAAPAVKVTLQILEARTPHEIESSLVALVNGPGSAIYVTLDPLFFGPRKRIAELAAEARLPAMYDVREFVEAGGLMSYGPSFAGSFRRVAYFVDKVLKGVNPAELPVEQPTKFELVINLKTAKALDLSVPQSLLVGADEVIE